MTRVRSSFYYSVILEGLSLDIQMISIARVVLPLIKGETAEQASHLTEYFSVII
jgi:hypothetical protein